MWQRIRVVRCGLRRGRPWTPDRHLQAPSIAWDLSDAREGCGGTPLLIDEVLHVFPLVSAASWAVIGLGAFARYGTAAPFTRALTLFCLLVSAGCLTDWYLLTFVSAGSQSFAIDVANLRTSFLAVGSLVILLASKWIDRGHSRYDPLLALPVAGALVVIWSGMTPSVSQASWGPVLGRDPLLFGLFVLQEVAYYGVTITFVLSFTRRRWYLPPRLRRPMLLSVSALLVFVLLWLPTNVYAALAQPSFPPLFSSLLFVPALLVVTAFIPRTREELGEVFRAVSDLEDSVLALYVFYRTGDPLVAVAGTRSLPIEAEQLQSVLDTVQDFVQTSLRKTRRYDATTMQFDRIGIVAVRGEWIIVTAIFEGAAYDALRGEIHRYLEAFEDAHRADLGTFEGASRTADVVADDLHAWLKPMTSGRPTAGRAKRSRRSTEASDQSQLTFRTRKW